MASYNEDYTEKEKQFLKRSEIQRMFTMFRIMDVFVAAQQEMTEDEYKQFAPKMVYRMYNNRNRLFENPRWEMTEVPKYAFYQRDDIESIKITAGGLVSVDEKAFEGCTSLKSVILGKSVRNINTDAFKNCSALEEIKVEDGGEIRQIESNAFEGCSNFKLFYLADTNLDLFMDMMKSSV